MRNTTKRIFIIVFAVFSALLTFSCRSVPSKSKQVSREIMAKGRLTPEQLTTFFLKHKPEANKSDILKLAKLYVREAADEDINSDVAFAQMCHETGYLTFGNLVKPEMHNYCGLGAMDAEHPGEWFETEELGVRAHIQHLQAYATKEDVKLNKPLVDPRYNWVHKTKYIRDIHGLAGTWATDKEYAVKLERILSEMENLKKK